jgi:hypothetical protein
VPLVARRDLYTALNSAADSPNAVHGDGARQYGFRSGLVPGITLLAYACESLRLSGDEPWVRSGYVKLAYRRPVYDGDPITVEVADSGATGASVALRAHDGHVAASGAAALGDARYSGRRPAAVREPAHSHPIEMTGANLVEIETLRSTIETVTPQDVAEDFAGFGLDPSWYLARDVAPLACVAKTYFPFSDANFVRNGPSLLVENELLVLRTVRLGEPLTVRGRIDRLFTRSGRRYVTTELGWWDDAGEAAVWEVQTSIYNLA